MGMVCDCCGKELNIRNCKIVRGIKKIKVCKECEVDYIKEIKGKYYVETYKGNDIYLKDGGYYPYWESFYFFNTLEGCRTRIDDKHICIM